MPDSCDIKIRFFAPPALLRRYFNAFFLTEVSLAEGETVSDALMPSYGIVNYHSGGFPEINYPSGKRFYGGSLMVLGPFSKAARLTVGSIRHWGLGLLPAGWAKFVREPAVRYANGAYDGHGDPAFAAFQPLDAALFADAPDCEAELARIESHFLGLLVGQSDEYEARIESIFAGLQDESLNKASELADRAGVSLRTLERVCSRAFGFPPKMLLRRQRFLRSMSQRHLEPSATWTDAIDDGYHDQAHFVREFRQFMGMSPSEFAAFDRPLAVPMARERVRYILAREQEGPNRET